MPTCDEREVQIEQQAHGGLDPEGAAELSAHVASCASCQAFAALIRRVEGQLAERAVEAEKSVAWVDCERRVHREARGMRALPWALAALCLGVPGAFVANVAAQLARGRPSEGMGLVASLTAAFFAGVFVAGWRIRKRWLSRYTQALVSREGLFAMVREQLAEDRRGARQAGVTLLLGAAVSVAVSALAPKMIGIAPSLLIALAAVLVACGLYLLLGRVPRIDRQLRELV